MRRNRKGKVRLVLKFRVKLLWVLRAILEIDLWISGAMRGNQKGLHVVCNGIINQGLVWKYSFTDFS